MPGIVLTAVSTLAYKSTDRPVDTRLRPLTLVWHYGQGEQEDDSHGISSVQFSLSGMSDSLQPHGVQHARPPCPSPTPGVYSNSCPLSWRYHPTISFSVIPFPSCLRSFPASRSFQMSQLFAAGGQSIGVSASASVLPVNTQD